MQALLTHMHASQRAQAQQNARWPASANPMNAMFTCVVLQPLPAKAMRQELEANPAAAKEHAGTRFVGYVLHGEPGWTSTGGAADAASGKERGAKKAAAATAPVRGEKLSRQAGEAVLMHSYDLKNKGGSYYKDKRSEQYSAIAPGMILSVRIFGDQLLKVLEKQTEDLHVFDVVHVEVSMKSMQSTAAELKLDIKRVLPMPDGARLLSGWTKAPGSVEQSTELLNTLFLGGAEGLIAADLMPQLDQNMVRGNLSQTVHMVRVPLLQAHGLFAVHPDGHMRFHVQGQLRDLNASVLRVQVQPQQYGNPPLDWLCKLFNVALKLPGVLHAMVVVDTYRAARLNAVDVQLDTLVQLNTEALLRLAEERTEEPLPTVIVEAFEKQGMQGALRYLSLLYTHEEEDLRIVVDTRKMSKKVGAVVDGDTWTAASVCVAHPSSKWAQAHSMYIFLKGQPVLNLVYILGAASADFMVQASIEPVQLVAATEDVEYDIRPEAEPAPAKKAKKAATAET